MPRYVALPASTQLEDLVGITAAKKGGMKKAHAHRVGPVRQLQGLHTDGRALSISLQAVLKDGSSTSRLVAVVKASQPVKGTQVGRGWLVRDAFHAASGACCAR